jgi:hypothetical protein
MNLIFTRPHKILSDNSKTIVSLNLPIHGHCRPTEICLRKCYAKSGHLAFPLPVRKQYWVSKYLSQPNIKDLIEECRSYQAVRLSGSGDLKQGHIPQVLKLARECPKTEFWGMTRKTEIASVLTNRLPNLRLMVSIDRSSPSKARDWAGALCWGPRMPGDSIPQDTRFKVFFPCHQSGRVLKNMEPMDKDCPGVWHKVKNCLSCTKCWTYV